MSPDFIEIHELSCCSTTASLKLVLTIEITSVNWVFILLSNSFRSVCTDYPSKNLVLINHVPRAESSGRVAKAAPESHRAVYRHDLKMRPVFSLAQNQRRMVHHRCSSLFPLSSYY